MLIRCYAIVVAKGFWHIKHVGGGSMLLGNVEGVGDIGLDGKSV